MGNRHCKLSGSDVDNLLSCSSFSTDQIVEMHRDFVREYPSGSIDHDSFMRSYEARFPHADCDFCERLFHAHDFDGNGKVSFGEFLISLNVANNGDAEDKLRWAFRMYDVDGDGTVSHSEIVDILKVLYFLSLFAKNSEHAKQKNTRRTNSDYLMCSNTRPTTLHITCKWPTL